MNTRERFLEVMKFNKSARACKWEFGYWGSTLNRWYAEGMPEKQYPAIPTQIVTTNASVYTWAWTHNWRNNRTVYEKLYGERFQKIPLPDGIAVWGGALYWPSQGFPLDLDVADYFRFDKSTVHLEVEQFFYPRFEPAVVEEDEQYLTYTDIDGVTRKFQKKEQVIPPAIDSPIKDWKTWQQLKEERLRLDNITARFPDQWAELLQDYKNRDYPLALGGYPLGFFGTLAHLIGYHNLFLMYYDQPDLLHDILGHFTNLWIAIWEEVLAQIDVDMAHIWEDVSSSAGPMISKKIFKAFMTPYYKKITDFLKGKGVDIILVDTDGDCRMLIPLFIEAGVTGLYPMEVSAGMDVVAARKEFPQLQIMGGIPKADIAMGEKRVDEFLEPVNWLLSQGGYIPFGDHLIPPEVPWDCYQYYRHKLNAMIDQNGEM